jgi:photosystem II stability/assembly factor-like uncharacterized protein
MWGGVDFLDAKRGWIVGAELQGETILPLILATTDGGPTWIHQTTEPGTVPLQVCAMAAPARASRRGSRTHPHLSKP